MARLSQLIKYLAASTLFSPSLGLRSLRVLPTVWNGMIGNKRLCWVSILPLPGVASISSFPSRARTDMYLTAENGAYGQDRLLHSAFREKPPLAMPIAYIS
jgi:hypothetical protein